MIWDRIDIETIFNNNTRPNSKMQKSKKKTLNAFAPMNFNFLVLIHTYLNDILFFLSNVCPSVWWRRGSRWEGQIPENDQIYNATGYRPARFMKL